MEYTVAMNYIEEKSKLGTVPGLVNVKELLLRLDNPQNKCACLHIAGTNGKGSIFAFVQEALIKAGYKVARYISPTIFDYRERFQINKEYISEKRFCELLEKVSKIVDVMVFEGGYDPTAFEIETAIAFQYFYEENVDFVLVECGMGGLLDATNVIDNPLLTVFASISMDHMQFLGDSLAEIAANKAGIIKPDGYCVSYAQEEVVRKVLDERSKNLCAKMYYASTDALKILSMDIEGSKFLYKEKEYEIGLLGEHQIYNAIVAIEVLEKLSAINKVKIEYEDIYDGIKETKWLGRLTRVSENPPIYVDGAHNEAAWLFLKGAVNKYFTNKKIIYIIGVLKDKEYTRMVDILKDTMNYVITVTPNTPRGLSKEILAKLIAQCGIEVDCADSSKMAIELAKKKADKDSVILVSGSLSFILDYLQYDEED